MTGRIERRQHLITLDDLGDRVQWKLEEDDDGVVDAGVVSLADYSDRWSIQTRLDAAFDAAASQARWARTRRFQEDLDAVIKDATTEE
jgi:hypothetical protein